MKHLVKLWIVSILVLTLLSLAWAEDAPKKEAKGKLPKIAVKTLTGKGIDADTAATLTEALCTRIMTFKKYQVMCASDVNAILAASQQLALLGSCEDDSCYEILGKVLNSSYVLNGSIGKVGKSYVISLSLISTESKKVVKRITHEVPDSGDLLKGIREAADYLKN